jgi:hypothetical protein
MRFLQVILAGALATSDVAFAWPGMKGLMTELNRRQGPPGGKPNVTVTMIGDLVQGATTPVGHEVQDCLLGTISCQDLTSVRLFRICCRERR